MPSPTFKSFPTEFSKCTEVFNQTDKFGRYCPNSIFIEKFPKSSETHKTQISSRNSNFSCLNAISEINISCVIAENVDYFVHNIESAFFCENNILLRKQFNVGLSCVALSMIFSIYTYYVQNNADRIASINSVNLN